MCAEALSVSNFYEGKSIFITGATGGIGKLLIEKLLRSCTKIKNIYLLLRKKRGKTTAQRATTLFNTPVFNRLRERDPEIFKKIIVIEGDLCLPNLGMTDADEEFLIKNISIVFHCAASLKFDANLEEAIAHNVFGTQRLLQLCQKMIKIEALVHVSTLYSTCNNQKIEESLPSIPAMDDRIDFTKNIHDFVKSIPLDVVDEWPNTYTFSKALAEIMLNNQKGTLPVSIVRPSIVLSTLKEPVPGWIDNFYGPTLTIANGALGILRSVICDGEKVADVVPSDIVVNLLICVGCKTKYQRTNDIKIYNCCSGRQNPMQMKQLINDCQNYARIYPPMSAIRYPDLKFRTSYSIHSIHSAIQHNLLSYVLDLISICTSAKPRMVKVHRSIGRVLSSLDFFTTRQWLVDDYNVEMLNRELSEKERKTFYFDVKSIDWRLFARDYSIGIRKYLFKEDMTNVEAAIVRINNLYWIEKCVQALLSISSAVAIYCWINRRRRKH